MEKVVFNKISPAQFWFIHHEITGDNTSSENIKQTEYDERINLIIKNSDESLIRDLRVNNARKSKYDKFWDIAKQQLDELTAVNDRRHSEGFINTGEVVVNMAIAISARDLYEKIKAEGIKQGLTEEEFPSFSWFKFYLYWQQT